MPQKKHLYRVSVYIGKENYERLENLGKPLGFSVATMARLMLATGMQMANIDEKGAMFDGNK